MNSQKRDVLIDRLLIHINDIYENNKITVQDCGLRIDCIETFASVLEIGTEEFKQILSICKHRQYIFQKGIQYGLTDAGVARALEAAKPKERFKKFIGHSMTITVVGVILTFLLGLALLVIQQKWFGTPIAK